MLVRVAIDLALDRLFDYEVPEALEKKLADGQLLLELFRRRIVEQPVERQVDRDPDEH